MLRVRAKTTSHFCHVLFQTSVSHFNLPLLTWTVMPSKNSLRKDENVYAAVFYLQLPEQSLNENSVQTLSRYDV